MKKSKLLVWMALAILIAAGLYGWKEYTRGHVNTNAINPVERKTVAELVTAFEADENKADALFNDKVILVNGKVQHVGIEDNIVSILLSYDSSKSGVLCQFEKSEQEKLEDIKTGDMVAIKGICTGYLIDVILARCVLNN